MGEKDRATLLRTIVEQYASLAAYLTRRFGSPSVAADAVQDTYLRLQRVEAVPDIVNPRAYVFRAADMMAREQLRREGRHPLEALAEDHPLDAPQADVQLHHKQRLRRLAQAVDELPPRCRQVFLLNKFEGLDYGAIATRLGISRSAVEKHMMKALAHCRDRVGR